MLILVNLRETKLIVTGYCILLQPTTRIISYSYRNKCGLVHYMVIYDSNVFLQLKLYGDLRLGSCK